MRPLLCAALLCLTAGRTSAADAAKPNTLTPQEIADGWLLLFDGETRFGWKTEGQAKAENGILHLAGDAKQAFAEMTSRFNGYDWSYEQRRDGNADWELVRLRREPGRSLDASVTATSPAQFRNVKLRPTGLQSIFNGKDLTGWKVNPGEKYKSVFSVNDRGELNVNNGPGDLQSEGQWADFVLQLECISNGDHLNSGIFFRCRPNEYQQGYEAQIRNQFHEQADQKYTLEVYDPQTHELKEKKPALYTAVDYGTGAIYRRQPARKQMSRDKEWFAMTIVAQGRHFAVWVNGVQVTDWTDNRPLRDNARNGCRLDKGPISIQGHDPTTDLSFRNIRIAELPKLDDK